MKPRKKVYVYIYIYKYFVFGLILLSGVHGVQTVLCMNPLSTVYRGLPAWPSVSPLLGSLQKSPAKKLSHAISKSLGCVPMGEAPHPLFPEQAERPQETHTHNV